MNPIDPKPGDYLLSRYFPTADQETRERAREAFRQYAMILFRLGTKIEQQMERSGDSPIGGDGVIL